MTRRPSGSALLQPPPQAETHPFPAPSPWSSASFPDSSNSTRYASFTAPTPRRRRQRAEGAEAMRAADTESLRSSGATFSPYRLGASLPLPQTTVGSSRHTVKPALTPRSERVDELSVSFGPSLPQSPLIGGPPPPGGSRGAYPSCLSSGGASSSSAVSAAHARGFEPGCGPAFGQGSLAARTAAAARPHSRGDSRGDSRGGMPVPLPNSPYLASPYLASPLATPARPQSRSKRPESSGSMRGVPRRDAEGGSAAASTGAGQSSSVRVSVWGEDPVEWAS